MTDQVNEVIQIDENHVIAERREKLKALRESAKLNGGVAFPNDFKPDSQAAVLHAEFGGFDNEVLDPKAVHVSIAGRM
ncbi:MAG: lysine--tRNA ligase, partial [Methylotenera sp.]|nr:lysine--tRNA ligase [Methylotenera sp.]